VKNLIHNGDNYIWKRLPIYLLLFIVSLIFIPSVFGEFVNLDDLDLVARLARIKQVDFSHLFFGERSGALYYRPLLVSTYYLEKLFLVIDPVVMRFNNVLLQLANSIWVYLVVAKIYALKNRHPGWWPLLWGLLFGLHPLATESANWVSGRTDLLAGFFILAATWLLLKYRQEKAWFTLGAAFLCAFCAMLSKEVAVAFIPGMFFLLASPVGSLPPATVIRARLWRLVGGGLCLGGAVGCLIYLRSLLVATNISSIGRTIEMFVSDYTYSAMLFFRLFGFYAKKIVAPWPLNLAIVEVDPFYDLLGVVIVVLLLWLFVRNRLSTDLFVIAALLLLPAYPISFGQVAWTPYAERYAYVATAFVIFGSAALCADHLSHLRSERLVAAGLLLLLLCYVPTTYVRNHIWQSSVTLWADTVKKSPHSRSAHSNYGSALYRIGDFKEAERQFDAARGGIGYNYSAKHGLIYAQLLFDMGRRVDAVTAVRDVVERTEGNSLKALKMVVAECSRSSLMVGICGGFEVVSDDFSQLYDVTSDPRDLVEWADFTGSVGESAKALALYHRAALALPANHPLQEKIKTAIAQLNSSG